MSGSRGEQEMVLEGSSSEHRQQSEKYQRLEAWFEQHSAEMGEQAKRYRNFLNNFIARYSAEEVHAGRKAEAWLNFLFEVHQHYDYQHPDLLIEGFLEIYQITERELGMARDAWPKWQLVSYGRISRQFFLTREEAEAEKQYYEGMQGHDPENLYAVGKVPLRASIEEAALRYGQMEAQQHRYDRILGIMRMLHPEIAEQMEHNLASYGVPALGAGQGDLSVDDLPSLIRRIIRQDSGGNPVEILIRPEDADTRRYCLEYHILKATKTGFVRALDYESQRHGGNGEVRP